MISLQDEELKSYIYPICQCIRTYLKNHLAMIIPNMDEKNDEEILNMFPKRLKIFEEFIENDGVDWVLKILKQSSEEWNFNSLNSICFEILILITYQSNLTNQKSLIEFILNFMENNTGDEENLSTIVMNEPLKIMTHLLMNHEANKNIDYFRNFNGIRILLDLLKMNQYNLDEILMIIFLLSKNEKIIQIFENMNLSFYLSEHLLKQSTNSIQKNFILKLLSISLFFFHF
jgi:hypothetical protein